MDWIEDESIRFSCPAFADVFVGREALKGLEPAGEVVGGDEVGEVLAELVLNSYSRGIASPHYWICIEHQGARIA
jgi:hypothetical protein